MLVLKFSLITIIWLAAMSQTNCSVKNQIPNVCHGEPSVWGATAVSETLLIANDLLKSFHESMPADLTHWYLSAWADEYTNYARNDIVKVNNANLLTRLMPRDEGDLNAWEKLGKCQRVLIRYQQILNTLASQLQCALSTALIVTQSFYLDVMPATDNNSSSAFCLYVREYNSSVLKSKVLESVKNQSKCARRMLSAEIQSAWNEWEVLTLSGIEKAFNRKSNGDSEADKRLMQTVEFEAKGLFERYLREGYGDEVTQWTDCHVIAEDLDGCQEQVDRQFHRFFTLASCQKYLSGSRTWYTDMSVNYENILRVAATIYHKASVKLADQFKTKLDSIKSMPNFTHAANGLLATLFKEFAEQILLWRVAIQNYEHQSANRAEFLTKCNALREHFATIPETAKRTEDQLRAIFREHAVYVPIILSSRATINPNDARRLIADYSAEFNAQFGNNSRLHSESRLKVKEAKEKSLFGKKYSSKKVYFQRYSEFLADRILALDADAWKLDAAQHWSSYYFKLSQFVEALNEYGDDSFKLIYPKAYTST